MNVNEYGLVPGKAVKNFDVFKAGQLCGFEPHVAERLVNAGVWKPAEPEVEVEIKATGKRKAVKEEADKVDVFLVGVDSGTVKIPQNWREETVKSRLLWAKQINMAATKETADDVIAAAVKEQEDALQKV